jgi:hypothetical protein
LISEELLSSRPPKHIQVLIRDSKSKIENRRKRKRKENITEKKLGEDLTRPKPTKLAQLGSHLEPSQARTASW